MLIVFIRTLILYIIIVACIRFMGKRQIGELSPTELVVAIMISNIATLPIENINIPTLTGALPIISLVCFEVITSYISSKFPKFRNLVSGSAKILIENGRFIQKNMDDLRLSPVDILEEMRQKEIFDIRDVSFCIMETNGKISFHKVWDAQNVTAKMMALPGKNTVPQMPVIVSGTLIDSAMEFLNIDLKWIERIVAAKGLTIAKTYLMLCDGEQNCVVIGKERR